MPETHRLGPALVALLAALVRCLGSGTHAPPVTTAPDLHVLQVQRT